eukprot:gnl/TRDRNA2_/TRDRNA2_100648_c0_seq1.p1 gnl/TRDRNA2_/TRDRNA2_100648_c0~~gnl/TRDRNA2_/TRDRNA2_100648_c0_seq1.p1  ORF type:complete len:625 (-),score=89.95 gnl/TRDRNA2_/TRDRNA2_100648_c0_seq1:57-1931(-)
MTQQPRRRKSSEPRGDCTAATVSGTQAVDPGIAPVSTPVRLFSGVCIIDVDDGTQQGTGFLAVFADELPGLPCLVTCRHVLPTAEACALATCSFEEFGRPALTIGLEASRGFLCSGPPLDVAIVRVAANEAARVLQLRAAAHTPYHIVFGAGAAAAGSTGGPPPGKPLHLTGYGRGRTRGEFFATATDARLGGDVAPLPAGQLAYRIDGAADAPLPVEGTSGAPVFSLDATGDDATAKDAQSRVVAVHMGLDRTAQDGRTCRATLLSAVRAAAGGEWLACLRRPVPPPPFLQLSGRRGTNDAANGVYALHLTPPSAAEEQVTTTNSAMTTSTVCGAALARGPARHNGFPYWELQVAPGGAGGGGEGSRPLFVYHGQDPHVWAIGTRLGDGRLRCEGGSGGLLARRTTAPPGGEASGKAVESDDPSEIVSCALGEVNPTALAFATWCVAADASSPGTLTADPLLELRGLDEESFATIKTSWRRSLHAAAGRVASAVKHLEVTGFPGLLGEALNGPLERRPEAWNRYPAWHRLPARSTQPPGGKADESPPVFLYRDASDTKWVLGWSLGDGHSRAAHVYTSMESPAGGHVWEVDCGAHGWRPLLRATVREAEARTRRGSRAAAGGQ